MNQIEMLCFQAALAAPMLSICNGLGTQLKLCKLMGFALAWERTKCHFGETEAKR